ncbi:MAG: HNH endonuclease [Rhodospirillaceae bacterium]|nr:HNH endonuclease [Rhodospirillaceae bacterium]
MSRRHHALSGPIWAATRRAVFRRDGWRCTSCGRAGRLEAHHEPPLVEGADPYDLAGIVTLCRTCHIERHRGDAETPGRAEWRKLVEELAGSD